MHHIPDHTFHSSSISYATVQFVISIFIFQEILILIENKKEEKMFLSNKIVNGIKAISANISDLSDKEGLEHKAQMKNYSYQIRREVLKWLHMRKEKFLKCL